MPYANLTTILVQQKETIDGTELKINNTSSDSITFSLSISKYNTNTTSVYIDGTLYDEIRETKDINITLTSGEHTILITGDQNFSFPSYIIGSDNNKYLTSAKLKITYNELKARNFFQCSNLTSVEMEDYITSIKDYCFYQCSSLTSINLPNNLTELGNSCFNGCSSLTSIVIPDSVTTIGSRLCQFCSSLTYLKLSNGLSQLAGHFIADCNNLTSITIPDSVTNITNYAFSEANGLTSITIPVNVKSVGNYAFKDASNLQSIKMKATTPPTAGTSIFQGCSKLTKIYVPAGTLSSYQTATNWTAYADKMEEYND